MHESEEQVPVQPHSPSEVKMKSQQQSATPMNIDHDSTANNYETLTDDSILPNPTTANLVDIKHFLEAMTTADREIQQELRQYIVDKKYIKKLVALLEIYENSEKASCLHTLRLILLHLMNLYDSDIIQEILKTSNFTGCLGILEYDADVKEGKAQYRQMFSRMGKFKEVVPIGDPDTMKLINQVIRLQFLKYKVLADTQEVDAISVVTLMSKAKNLELVQDIAYDRQLMKDLFDILKNPSEPKRRRNDVVLFVHQLCTMAKKTTIDVYRKLCPAGLFELLEHAFVSDDTRVKQAGVEIMQIALETSPRVIRMQIIEQNSHKGSKVFLDAILKQIIAQSNVDFISQFTDAVQTLLNVNPEAAEDSISTSALRGSESADDVSDRPDPSAEAFLDLFYTQYLSTLVKPVLELTRSSTSLDHRTSARCEEVCKLMTFLVQQHPSQLKVFPTSNCLLEKITLLFKNNSKKLRFVALKFFRACIDLNDDYFSRMLIRNKVIHSVIGLLQDTKGNRNAMNSACLEFFDRIRKNNIKLLVLQCATIHKEAMEGFSYTPIFKQLLALHTVKGGSRTASPPPQAMADSALPNIPPHYARPFFKNANKAECSHTDGSSSGPFSIRENGVESADRLMSELFGDDDDHDMVAAGNDVPQPYQLRHRLQRTDSEETKDCNATAANDCSSVSQTRMDLTISLPPTSAVPVASTIEAKESKSKRKRDDETEEDLKDGAARAQSRARLDSGVPGTIEAAAAITA
ncbi:Platinum sensitivity protein [Linnemannia hyalina]|uniref:Platinum sensitivity protein n=1 Tax=Linnemannia hyalina TaxID=64524 RepID=A0A9P8BX90_9FUNG|nr:Platinum sensitivity protein [Linnemannia hyalina]